MRFSASEVLRLHDAAGTEIANSSTGTLNINQGYVVTLWGDFNSASGDLAFLVDNAHVGLSPSAYRMKCRERVKAAKSVTNVV